MSDRDRAQLFLVTALVLGVILVTLALLLNSAIYTGNVATRDLGPDATDAVHYEQAAEDATVRRLQTVNQEHNESYDALHENFTDGMTNWTDAADTHHVAGGTLVDSQATEISNGSRIIQEEETNFTDANNASHWTIANATNARNFTLNVRRSLLVDLSGLDDDDRSLLLTSDTFHLNVTNESGDTYTIFFLRTGTGAVTVKSFNPDGTVYDACTETTDLAAVNVTNASLEGNHCSALTVMGEVGSDYDLAFGHADQADGNYSLIIDRPTGPLDTGNFHDADTGDDPFVTPALYSAHYTVTYRTTTAYYRDRYRVAPGEYDE